VNGWTPPGGERDEAQDTHIDGNSGAARVYTVVDHDHIELRSNAPWRLTLVSAEGVREVSGPRTGSEGALLEVPEGTTDYFVTLER
jgi:hypothetical protein